jgi:metal-responsive CopG/Arc/MetJ family transcriptional regulator
MPRPKKDAKVVNVKLDRNIHDRLDQFCEETGMTRTVALERILNQYLNEYFQKRKEDRMLFHEDKI